MMMKPPQTPSITCTLLCGLLYQNQQDPVSRGVVMYDLVNEPDNKKIFWNAKDGRPSLAKLYLDAMDAVTRVQPDAIFVLEVRVAFGAGCVRSNMEKSQQKQRRTDSPKPTKLITLLLNPTQLLAR